MRNRLVSFALVAAIVAAIVPLVASKASWSTLLWRTFQDFGHVPLFGVIAMLWLTALARWAGARTTRAQQYALAFAITMALGALTEFVQMLGPRDADVVDLLRNAAGAALALGVLATFDGRLASLPALRRPSARWGVRAAAALALAGLFLPVARVADAYVDRGRRLPVLFSFADRREGGFLRTRLAALRFEQAPPEWRAERPAAVARIAFSDLYGSAVVFNEPYPDWSGFTLLRFDVWSDLDSEVVLGLRIDDRHESVRYTDRYNRHLTIAPGINRIRIPLDEVRRGPAERELDMRGISRFVMFPVEPTGGFGLYLGPIRLEAVELVRALSPPS